MTPNRRTALDATLDTLAGLTVAVFSIGKTWLIGLAIVVLAAAVCRVLGL